MGGYFRSISASNPEHDCPRRLVLLQVDQQFPETSGLGVAQNSPIRSARSRSVQHEDVAQLGALTRREGLEASSERRLHLLEGHSREASASSHARAAGAPAPDAPSGQA